MSSSETSRNSSDVEMEDLKFSSSKEDIQKFKLAKYQSLSNILIEPSVTASEIRNLSSKYHNMLAQATVQIQKLVSEKSSLEREHNKLLESNVELGQELKHLYLEEKKWRQTEKEMILANEEFAAEVEKLYKNEEELFEVLENLKKSKRELLAEKDKQNKMIKKMFSENLQNISQLEKFRKQERKETELQQANDQLRLENDFLTTSQKNTADRVHLLEEELEYLKNDLKEAKEKVINLSSWKQQILEKNEELFDENEKLKLKTDHLESLVNEEVGDLTNILQTIDLLQGTQL